MRSLEDLVGQEEAVRHLQTLRSQDRLPHAMLFEGPEGTGKFSAARCLARTLLCHGEKDQERPCYNCSACTKIDLDSHADLHILTTDEKRIKIGQVREAEHSLRLRAVEGRAKLLLIEDAQRVTPQAQNALLKTLEEPPGNAYIILTTTRLRAILPTVVSRCQRIVFRPVPEPVIADHLVRTAELDRPKAMMIAALSQGSLGSAVRTVAEDLEELLERRDRIATFDERLGPKQSVQEALELGARLAEDRPSMARDLDLLLIWLHDQLIFASDAKSQIANTDQADRLRTLADARGLDMILDRSKTVMETRRQLELPFNLNAQMLAEEMCLTLSGHTRLQAVDR